MVVLLQYNAEALQRSRLCNRNVPYPQHRLILCCCTLLQDGIVLEQCHFYEIVQCKYMLSYFNYNTVTHMCQAQYFCTHGSLQSAGFGSPWNTAILVCSFTFGIATSIKLRLPLINLSWVRSRISHL